MTPLFYRLAVGEQPVAVGSILVVPHQWIDVRVAVERIEAGAGGRWVWGRTPDSRPVRVFVAEPFMNGSHPPMR